LVGSPLPTRRFSAKPNIALDVHSTQRTGRANTNFAPETLVLVLTMLFGIEFSSVERKRLPLQLSAITPAIVIPAAPFVERAAVAVLTLFIFKILYKLIPLNPYCLK